MNDAAPTAKELAAVIGGKKRGRIQVSPPEERTWIVDGKPVVFDSKHEMDHWKRFEGYVKCGLYTNLRRQVKYPLHTWTPNGFKVEITSYKADIVCEDTTGRTCVFDPKGQRTDRWKMIVKWMEAEYGIRVVEL